MKTSFRLMDLIKGSLESINKIYINHGVRVAFLMDLLTRQEGIKKVLRRKLIFASLFHDIGAYRTNEEKNLVRPIAIKTYPHCLEGYLFLKYFSPLENYADFILYHHSFYDETRSKEFAYRNGERIHAVDRLDVLVLCGESEEQIKKFFKKQKGKMFHPEDVDAIIKIIDDFDVITKLKTYTIDQFANFYLNLLVTSDKKLLFKYLKMLDFTFEYYSLSTLFHSTSTATIACSLAKLDRYKKKEKFKVVCAGMIHDIGKTTTPLAILEKPTKLTDDEMKIMKQHVVHTKEICEGIVDDDILTIAYRHHERIHGSGYPEGLKGDQLSKYDKLLAVSDVISALYFRRSYKEVYQTDEVVSVLKEMVANNKIDKYYVDIYMNNINYVLKELQRVNAYTYKRYKYRNEDMKILKKEPPLESQLRYIKSKEFDVKLF